MDIPKPDYSELRKSIPTHENTLDPRLRRILRIKDDYPETDSFVLSTKASPFSPPHEPEAPVMPATKMDTISGDPRRQRTDPRRPNAHIGSGISTNATSNSTVLNKQSISSQPASRSVQLDIQNILQKSNWYKDCSSKQKIMVNQQLAIVSTELKKFHADPSENKIFDLNFINQNPLLQEVLTNLGIFISDDGEFVQLDQTTGLSGKDMSARTAAANSQGLVDLMSIPMDIDYLRNQQQQQEVQQQQQAAALQAINALGGPRFLGQAGATAQMLSFASLPGDVIRPGLLGIAPNMPLNDAYNLMQNAANQNAAFFNNRGSGGGSGGGGSNSGGGGGGGNNRRTGGGMRRNQFDRNNSRRK